MSDWFSDYDWLRFDRPSDGVLRITMPEGDNLGAVDEARHGVEWADSNSPSGGPQGGPKRYP